MLVCANQLFYLIDSYIISIESLINLKYFCEKGNILLNLPLLKANILLNRSK